MAVCCRGWLSIRSSCADACPYGSAPGRGARCSVRRVRFQGESLDSSGRPSEKRQGECGAAIRARPGSHHRDIHGGWIDPDEAHKQSKILLASKVTNTNSVSGLSKAWKRIRASVDEKLGYEAGHFTMHDIRRTVATGLQRLGIPLVVSEAVLNHQSGSAMAGVAGVYHRHQYTNEKREALALWGKEVMQIAAKYPAEAKDG